MMDAYDECTIHDSRVTAQLEVYKNSYARKIGYRIEKASVPGQPNMENGPLARKEMRVARTISGARRSSSSIDNRPGPAYESSDHEPEFLGPVAPELREAGLAAQKKRWLQAAQTGMLGPLGWIEIK